MCGIVGVIGEQGAQEKALESLKRLEYRGYDSAGIAVNDEKGITVEKGKGRINKAINKDSLPQESKIAIAHTRWSTHGEPKKENSHPHLDCKGEIAAVHNGIIKNHKEIKKKLRNHEFKSTTDSEVIPHLIEEKLKNKEKTHRQILKALKETQKEINGQYAVLISIKGQDKIYGFKKDSPLCIGIGNRENYFSSDIYSFSHLTNQSIFLEDREIALIDPKGHHIYNGSLEEVKKEPEEFEWNQEESKRKEKHYMLSEIKQQPEAVQRQQKKQTPREVKRLIQPLMNHDKTVLTASGTSYHASLLGAYLLQKADQETQAIIASEYKNYIKPYKDTLTIGVSQSGETMDVIKALEHAETEGSTLASIVNVPKSTIARKTKESLKIYAGQEIAVASTKTFTNQVTTFARIAKQLGLDIDISSLSEKIQKTLKDNEERIKKLAEELSEERDIYIIGKGPTYPVAREIALKLKEIPYIHAEGMMAGELKHGTLALIEKDTPVISLRVNEEMLKTEEEIESKGANIIPISTDTKLNIPQGNEVEKALCSNIVGQLLSYYTARERNCSIDKPRHLAKAVSVQ